MLPLLARLFPLLGVAAFSFVPFCKPFLGPIPNGILTEKWDGEVCLQSTSSTCGLASMASVLKVLGEDVSEPEIAHEAHSYSRGTEAWYLARVARARGYEVEFQFTDPGEFPEEHYPSVVGVNLDGIGHFIPILGKEGELFITGDPLTGREVLSRSELEELYTFTGFQMAVRKKP